MPFKECLNVQANIRLKTTTEGGRQNGIVTGYRPNHVFEYYGDGMIHSFIHEGQKLVGEGTILSVE